MRTFYGLATLLLIALCVSSVWGFLENFDCNTVYDCSGLTDKVCGTDGVTYDSKCALDKINQEKTCKYGDFNTVMVVHNREC